MDNETLPQQREIIEVAFENVVDSLDLISAGIEAYLDLETSEVIFVSEEQRSAIAALNGADSDSDDADSDDPYEEESIKVAEVIENKDGRYLQLPDSFEINEYKVMEEFAISQEIVSERKQLESSIRGAGAFKRFKNKVKELDLQADWFQFKKEHMKAVAQKWCEENNLKVPD